MVEDENKLYFIYAGNLLDKELTFQESINDLDKGRNIIKILVGKEPVTSKNKKYKSEEIICPKCNENSLLTIKDYKIKLFDCKNRHDCKNILITEFENTQLIDPKNTLCNNCKEKDIINSFNNEIYICNSCHIFLCPLCKTSHSKEHKIIKYKERNYICKLHNENYIKFCEQCRINICMSCEKEHKEHSIIYFGDILPDEKKIKNDLKEFRKSVDNFKNEIEEIITKLNNLSENIEIYYSIFDNIVKANDNTKRNYQMLRNFKEFDNYINFFIKDINKVINDDNIIDKFNDLMDIDYKINNKDLSNKNKSENEKIIEKLKEEIKNFENIIENIIENNNKILNEKDKNLEQLNKEIISMRNTINENFSKNIELTNKLQANEKEINNLKSQLINKDTEISNLQSNLKNKDTEKNNLQSNLNNKDTEINNLQSNNNYFGNNENQINYNYQPNIFRRQNTFQPSLNNPQNFGSQYNLIYVVYHEDPFEAKNWIKCGICSNMNSGYKCSRCSLEMCTFCFSKIETKSISNRKSKHPHNLFIKFCYNFNNYNLLGFKCDICNTYYDKVQYYFHCKECNFKECLLCLYDNKNYYA